VPSLDLVIDGQVVWLPWVALLGCGVGVIAGMFGVGGGFLLTPLLHVFLGIPLPIAVGAALCQTIATAHGSLLRYRHLGEAESRFDLMLLGGSLLGVDAGTRVLAALSGLGTVVIGGRVFATLPLAVTGVYTGVFATLAALLWWKPTPAHDVPVRPGPLARLRIPPCVDLPTAGLRQVSGPVVGAVGFGTGLLAGLIGIGGGLCLIPIMLYGYGFDMRKTARTGLVVVLVVAAFGTVQHARLGHVHLGLAATVMIGAAVTAQIGVGLTRSLPASTLRKVLAAVVVATIAALVVKLFR
jgi:uncharacterized membrane protein YfcA